ncbi:MAG: bifunctional phosphoribosyl-AMP cyclohydrolase/phosphoribosyl-ATP diphosphatase HisIE [Erysipelothrix sp.]|nr:bifunctional phosphoribosyl-AMP cyclohydrolase/phosphoribosyl-ATP diphosphatase HisIE [Erysipelothrix sp.]
MNPFEKNDLIPCIVQDINTKEVLMMAYMNQTSFHLTQESGYATFYSRSRQSIWKKGETSGNTLQVISISWDCDQDTLLCLVQPKGPACHTGKISCFDDEVKEFKSTSVWTHLFDTIKDRQVNPKEGAYTTYLFTKGLDKMLKKVGEETAEIIIASKNESKEELVGEIADLAYHLAVVMVEKGVSLQDIEEKLASRIR